MEYYVASRRVTKNYSQHGEVVIMLSEKDKLKKQPHYIQYDLILFIF